MVQLNYFHFTHLTCLYLFLLLFLHVAYAQISTQPLPTYLHHNWEPSFAITTGAVICALLLLGLIYVYMRKCTESQYNTRTNNTSQRPCSCSQGINKELLNTFPILFYSTIKDLKRGKGSLECAVCLNDFKDYDSLRLLPKCNHVFHPSCIHSWLCSHVTCPVCRADLNDSCEVSITVESHLSTPQRVPENPSFLAEQVDGEENNNNNNPIEQNANQVVSNLKECEGNNDFGSSKLKLLRSNSTGHSVLESGKNMERYTLMLPEDIRKYILVNHNQHGRRVQRSASYNNDVMMPVSESSRKCWSYSEEYKNMRMSFTPPIVASRG
ncbi:hypothetical protein Lal_00019946 [Lupinus albus]|uniref:RING-type E3 ubiquitin transferase n=1 Tax=Lupinus albus TaxID=3870 RepID=A0A6A4R4L3_LUPAL|nr:putative transcription factor C2H2 family [Lupinus albus]KAF1899814.1 hypothetical protein Lal_00019946 [Lupinus albus]